MHHHATLLILRGDPGAKAALDAAYEFGATAGRTFGGAFVFGHRYVPCWHQGRLDQVEEFIREWLGRAPSHALLKAVNAHILADTGQTEVAARLFDELAATGFAHPTNNTAWLWFHLECAWLCARFHRSEYVAPLRATLQPYSDQLVVGGFAGFVGGPVTLYLAILASTEADWPGADAYFAVATATLERVGARPWLAYTKVERARMLLARDEPGDGEQARDLLSSAVVTARELGLAKIEQDATELLASP